MKHVGHQMFGHQHGKRRPPGSSDGRVKPLRPQLGGNKKTLGINADPCCPAMGKDMFFAPKFVWAKMMFDWTSGLEHWVKKGLAELGELPMFSHVHLFFYICIYIYTYVIVGYTVVPHSCPTIENSIS